MNKHITLLFLFIFFCSLAPAQSNKSERKLQKALEQAKSNKLDAASKTLEELLEETPGYGPAWDLLVKVRYVEYENSKSSDGLMENISISTKSPDGKEVENDSLARQLEAMLKGLKPSNNAYSKYLYTLRKAMLHSEDAFESSYTLRNLLVDPPVDTAVSKKALRYYNDAEEAFQKENYQEAAQLYKRAIQEQPDFYKARLYLGDAYYFTGNYHQARESFSEAKNTYPLAIEPRKFLVDAYSKDRMYSEALDEAISGMAVYPDASLCRKLEDAAYLSQKILAITWTPRPVFPNRVDTMNVPGGPWGYEDKDEAAPKNPWNYYSAAREKIISSCNKNGIIEKPTSLTKSKYMEVYSWEEMLANSNDPSLEEARQKQKDGYLDCYVLVTCYHFDFYDQYRDFASKNADRITAYYKKYLKAGQ